MFRNIRSGGIFIKTSWPKISCPQRTPGCTKIRYLYQNPTPNPLLCNRTLGRGFTGVPPSRSTKQIIPGRYFSIRKTLIGNRKWTTDDILALGSWLFVGNTLFFLLATTSGVSTLLLLINSLQFQEYFAKIISEFLTKETGISVTFKKAMVPRWKDGMIRLSDVHVSRQLDPAQQCTHFDVIIDRIDLSLDLLRWFDGRGLLRELHVRGVRGVVDRRHLNFTGVDPSSWTARRRPSSSDLDLLDFKLQDCSLLLLDYDSFRPYSILFHDIHCHRFRTQWLLYDILNADTLVGEYDTGVFTLNRPRDDVVPENISDQDITRIRISGLPIDLMSGGKGSPFGWISQGTVDIDMYHTAAAYKEISGNGRDIQGMVKIAEDMEVIRKKLMGEVVGPIKNKLMEELGELGRILDERTAEVPPTNIQQLDGDLVANNLSAPNLDDPPKELSFIFEVRFNNIRAELPSASDDSTSATTRLLMRPIIAYLNAQSKNGKASTPPVPFRFKLPLENFNGALTVYQCELMDKMGEKLVVALSRRVLIKYNNYLKHSKQRRAKKSPKTEQEINDTWYNWAFGWIMPTPSETNQTASEKEVSAEEICGRESEADDDQSVDEEYDENDSFESWSGRIFARIGLWSVSELGRQIVKFWESGRRSESIYSSNDDYDEMYNEIIWGHP